MREVDLLRKALFESKYTVALCCSGLLEEVGRASVRTQSRAYEIEMKYGYSPEEIFNAAFFSTRPEKFFDYYKAEILPGDMEPGESFRYLRELEQRSLIHLMITDNTCNFYSRVGCRNVIMMHGDVEDNVCINCGKRFRADYVAKSRGIPCCDDCGKILRPKVVMFGEAVDNRLMTRAINEITKAEVLLVIGANLDGAFAERYVKYFDGKKLVVIDPEDAFKDRVADLAIHRPVRDVLRELLEGC